MHEYPDDEEKAEPAWAILRRLSFEELKELDAYDSATERPDGRLPIMSPTKLIRGAGAPVGAVAARIALLERDNAVLREGILRLAKRNTALRWRLSAIKRRRLEMTNKLPLPYEVVLRPLSLVLPTLRSTRFGRTLKRQATRLRPGRILHTYVVWFNGFHGFRRSVQLDVLIEAFRRRDEIRNYIASRPHLIAPANAYNQELDEARVPHDEQIKEDYARKDLRDQGLEVFKRFSVYRPTT